MVGFNTFLKKTVNTQFVVRNISRDRKTVEIFGLKIPYGNSYDLLSIDYVSEADIQHALLKGTLRNKLLNSELYVISSNINLLQFADEQKAFLESVGITNGIAVDGYAGGATDEIKNSAGTTFIKIFSNDSIVGQIGDSSGDYEVDEYITLDVTGFYISGPNAVAGSSGTSIALNAGSSVTGNAGSIAIVGGNTDAGDGGIINLTGGSSAEGVGGTIYVFAGSGEPGGDVNIIGGGGALDESDGGDINLFSGVGGLGGAGGNISITARPAIDGDSGNISILTSDAFVAGAISIAIGESTVGGGSDITLSAGDGVATGGDVLISGGSGVIPGNVIINSISYPLVDGNSGEAIVTDGSGVLTFAALTTRFTVTSVQTSLYTASAFQTVRFNPSGGTFTINAPAGPSAGDQFRVKNVTSDVTAITISGNGANIEDPFASFALAGSISFGGDGATTTWEYSGTEWLSVNSV